MIDKRVQGLASAIEGIQDGAVVLVGGFGTSGRPAELLRAVLELGVKDLTIVANNATTGKDVVSEMLKANLIRKFICSFPRGLYGDSIFDELYHAGKLELELVPQGTLAERIRAGAAGIGGFYTRTSAGTELAIGKETRELDGQLYVLEQPLVGDVALIRAAKGDRLGNLIYHRGARINNPVMAGAAKLTIAQVAATVEVGEIDPEHIITPGIFVNRVVEVACNRD
ncbi:3-oxoacid CoA-transferase subunit A [Allopusillimonas ginsengisoli]|nr:3-oxoacid CoA-transferase subunit A [Allopusillimonas ginsengisoli]